MGNEATKQHSNIKLCIVCGKKIIKPSNYSYKQWGERKICSNRECKRANLSQIQIGTKHTEQTKLKMSLAHKGERAYQWTGDNAGYGSIHHWIRKQSGKAKGCEFCGRGGNYIIYEKSGKTIRRWSIQWANKSGKYLRDLSDWIALCVSCHKKYDMNNEFQIPFVKRFTKGDNKVYGARRIYGQ